MEGDVMEEEPRSQIQQVFLYLKVEQVTDHKRPPENVFRTSIYCRNLQIYQKMLFSGTPASMLMLTGQRERWLVLENPVRGMFGQGTIEPESADTSHIVRTTP